MKHPWPVRWPAHGTPARLKQPRPLLMLQAWSEVHAQLSRAVPGDVDVSRRGSAEDVANHQLPLAIAVRWRYASRPVAATARMPILCSPGARILYPHQVVAADQVVGGDDLPK